MKKQDSFKTLFALVVMALFAFTARPAQAACHAATTWQGLIRS